MAAPTQTPASCGGLPVMAFTCPPPTVWQANDCGGILGPDGQSLGICAGGLPNPLQVAGAIGFLETPEGLILAGIGLWLLARSL